MYNRTFTKEEFKEIIIICLQKLRNKDKYLLDLDVNERTITHKLAQYLEEKIPEFDVDCEYNRFKYADSNDIMKKLDLPKDNINWDDTEAKTVFPDIIIHERGPYGKNILVIEVKKSSSSILENHDRNKLIAFTDDPFNYELGLFLKIDVKNSQDKIEFYSKGEMLSE